MKLNSLAIALALVAGSLITTSASHSFAESLATNTREVTCSMNQVPTIIATLVIANENGVEALKSITVTDMDDSSFSQASEVDAVYNIPDVTKTSLFQNSQILQDYVDLYLTRKSVAFDKADLMLMKSEQDTPEEILESIADDLSGLMYVEAREKGQFTGAFLLAGWGGLYVNCTQK